jgi:hypothetical protein
MAALCPRASHPQTRRARGFDYLLPRARVSAQGGSLTTVLLSIRPPLSVANRFVAHCKREWLSYWEGLNELMKARGL